MTEQNSLELREEQPLDLSERLVLVIEKDDRDFELSKKSVRSQSPIYRIERAQTGTEALARLAGLNADVIVMDYEPPDMEGVELVRKLVALRPNCPVIVLTKIDSPDLALKVLRAGASDYLPKFGEYFKFLPRTITTNIQRALLLENLREMYYRVEQSSKDESLLNRLIVSIHGSLDLEDIIERAVNSLCDEFGTSRAILCLADDRNAQMRIVRQITKAGLSSISEKSMIFSKYHDLLLDIGERRPLVVMQEDTFAFATDVRVELVHYGILSMLMVPLVYRGRLMGLLHLDQGDQSRLWTMQEINLVTRIANQLAIALSQAKLYQLVETQSTSISKLTDLVSQLNEVVTSTKQLTERQESQEKVRVKLSTREIEVLKKVAEGLSNRDIAEALHITEGTTEVHVSRLRKKLNLGSRAALVRYAYENHLS